MQTITDLKSSMPQIGVVCWIGTRTKKRGEMVASSITAITTQDGIAGDHYSKEGGKRMVTLIQAEHIEVVGKILEKSIDPLLLRRNIVISGINLYALHDETFQIGDDLILRGTGLCHPCSRMETNLGPGGYNAMRNHGGITATVVKSGQIKLRDKVKLVPSDKHLTQNQ